MNTSFTNITLGFASASAYISWRSVPIMLPVKTARSIFCSHGIFRPLASSSPCAYSHRGVRSGCGTPLRPRGGQNAKSGHGMSRCTVVAVGENIGGIPFPGPYIRSMCAGSRGSSPSG